LPQSKESPRIEGLTVLTSKWNDFISICSHETQLLKINFEKNLFFQTGLFENKMGYLEQKGH